MPSGNAALHELVPPLDEQAVLDALSEVMDPEIPAVSLFDLGIVRGVRIDPPAVLVTPTYTGCPATETIERLVREALDAAGLERVAIQRVMAPAWTTDWITSRGRERLRAYGIAPPPEGAAAASLRAPAVVPCPRCGSELTQEVSRFGSTPCKAQWRCTACLEPFDRFKCH